MAPRPPRGGGPERGREPGWDDFVLPLPRATAAKIGRRPADGDNVGLWLDKLVWRLKRSFELKAEHRAFALSQLCRRYRSEAGAAAVERLREAAQAVHGPGRVRALRADVEGRLLVGYGRANAIETALTFHRVWGVPVIPGSALKGVARAWLTREGTESDAVLERCFGKMKEAGGLVFYDALPLGGTFELALDVLTPHMREYYEGRAPPADWLSPEPHTFVTVVRTAFVFVVGIDVLGEGGRPAEEAVVKADLTRGVKALQGALLEDGVGAKTAAGYGRFERFGDL